MNVILAIDGGATHTRCLAIDRMGRRLGEGSGGPSNHLLQSAELVRKSIERATRGALIAAGLEPHQIACVSAGLAGIDYDGQGAEPMTALFTELGFRGALLNGDMVIAHAGALDGRSGVVALAGTGSSILGIDSSGRRVKVGGWGPIYGNDGAAQRIAERSLSAAARAYDGRGPTTALLDAMCQALDVTDFRESIARLYGSGLGHQDVAALAPVAYSVALAGDAVAREIFTHAGEELAEGVVAAIGRLQMKNEEVTVSYQGSILEQCSLVLESMSEHVKHALGCVQIVPPRWPPVMGAYLLGCAKLDWKENPHELRQLHPRIAIDPRADH